MKYFQIIFISLGIFTYSLRVIYLLFNINLIPKLTFIEEPPSKRRLLLYYLVILSVCVYGFWYVVKSGF